MANDEARMTKKIPTTNITVFKCKAEPDSFFRLSHSFVIFLHA